MKVGDLLDLNVAYNGGAADSGLIYTCPEGNGIVSVALATGVVTALAEGESVIQVYHGTPSVEVATVIIEVASVETYAERLAIRQGDNAVVIGSAAVPQQPMATQFVPTANWTHDWFYLNQNFWQSGGNYLIRTRNNFLDSTGLSNVFDADSNTYVNLDYGADTFYVLIPVAKKLKKVEIDFLDADPNNSSIFVAGFSSQYSPTAIPLANVQDGHKAIGTTVIEINSDIAYPQFKVEFFATNQNRRVSAIRFYE